MSTNFVGLCSDHAQSCKYEIDQFKQGIGMTGKVFTFPMEDVICLLGSDPMRRESFLAQWISKPVSRFRLIDQLPASLPFFG
jgi:hypothetical protein